MGAEMEVRVGETEILEVDEVLEEALVDRVEVRVHMVPLDRRKDTKQLILKTDTQILSLTSILIATTIILFVT